MQVTNQINKKTKSSTIVQIAINILLRTVINSLRASIISNNNTSFLYLSNKLRITITPKPQSLNVKISQIMQEKRYFNYKKKQNTILNYLQKAMISIITHA